MRTKKRNPGNLVSWDFVMEDTKCLGGKSRETPEVIYSRKWATDVLEIAAIRLSEKYEQQGCQKIFNQLKPYIGADGERQTYKEIANELNTTTVRISIAINRLRKQYRKMIRQELARKVTTREEIDTEMKFLYQTLTGIRAKRSLEK